MEDILWLIPARSGSKSIKDKNIKDLNGSPLIKYRIKTALSLSKKEHVWVSTDSKLYADIALEYGATVPFYRPNDLSSDKASSMDVVLHAMNFAKNNGYSFNYIGLLEPTSPFVYLEDLINAYEELQKDNFAENIVATKENRPNTFFIQDDNRYLSILAERFKNNYLVGRQEFSQQVTPSGGFYIARWNSFIVNKTFYTNKTIGYLLPDVCALEIDEPLDWLWAEFLIKESIINLSKIYIQ